MDNDIYNRVLQRLKDGQSNGEEYIESLADQCEERNGLLFNKFGKRLIRDFEVDWVFTLLHRDPTAAHCDLATVIKKAQTRFVWQGMRQDLTRLYQDCWECNLRKPREKAKTLYPVTATDLFERWGIDIVGPLPVTERGNKYIIVAVDYFSRWPEARPLSAANAVQVANFIYEEIICRYGSPKILQSDRGTHFVNEVIRLLTEKFGIKHALSSPYHPESNGLVERFNRSLCEGIAKLADNIANWDQYIQSVLFAYRTKTLKVHGCTPWEIIYGRTPRLPVDQMIERHVEPYESDFHLYNRMIEMIDKVPHLRQSAKNAMKLAQDRLSKPHVTDQFHVGDTVLYWDKQREASHSAKLQPKWKGPYTVEACLPKGAYRLSYEGKVLKASANGSLLRKINLEKGEPIIVIEDTLGKYI